ncbi:MAG: ABC transporter permease subunit [Gemmatimonadaceae bacterium]
MNWRAIRAIVRKDLTVVRRSRAIMIPMIVVPILMLVVLPVTLSVLPALFDSAEGLAELKDATDRLPESLRTRLAGYTPQQAWIMTIHDYLLGPLFLLVPFMVASIIAADSFAGERERKTLEALLNAPAADLELFVAKVLAAWLPAMAVSVMGFGLYTVVANAAAWPVMGRVFFPNLTWMVLVFWVAPAFAVLALAGMVLVSLRVRGTQEAMQLGGFFVIPLLALIVGQINGLVLLGPSTMLVLGAVVWLLGALLLRHGARSFRRTKLIARL